MKINVPNLNPPPGTTAASSTQRPAQTTNDANTLAASSSSSSSDDVHLSELVRTLRSLAADSPERQNRIEQLARSYASGTYSVDTQQTAAAIIKDATKG